MRKIFGYFLAFLRTVNTLVGGFVSVALLLLLIVGLMSFSDKKEESPKITLQNNLLIFNPSGSVSERPAAAGALNVRTDVELEKLLRVLRNAALDSRIQAIVLRLEELSGISLLKARVIGRELLRFKQSGKPVIAYGLQYTQEQYLLASYADDIFMHPMGSVVLAGFGIERTYLKEALDKLGVTVNLFRSGKHKSAGEVFLQNEMSAEEKASNSEIVDTLWATYQNIVNTNRGLSPGYIRRLAEDPATVLQEAGSLNKSEAMLESGLVDGLMTLHEFNDYIGKLTPFADESFERIDYLTYSSGEDFSGLLKRILPASDNKIGLIVAEGVVVDRSDDSRFVISAESMVKKIRLVRDDDQVKALVVRLNTPGGSALASELIRQELDLLKNAGKPVVISMAEVAASGGYWIATTADLIWASKTTITGSIGVFTLIPTFGDALKNLGIRVDGVSVGMLAGASSARDPSAEFARWAQFETDSVHENFVRRLSVGRNLDLEEAARLANGRVWTGGKASELGLVDYLGDLEDALASAAELSQLDDWEVKRFDLEPPWSQWINLIRYSAFQALVPDFYPIVNHLQPDSLKILLDKAGLPQALCLLCRTGQVF